jgi:hypothetical protein
MPFAIFAAHNSVGEIIGQGVRWRNIRFLMSVVARVEYAYIDRFMLSGIIEMRNGHKMLMFAALTVGLLALLISDDRKGGFAWSLSVPDVVAVCAMGVAVYWFIKYIKKDERL